MELVTVPRVPVCRTGHFDLESGPVDFAVEHFAAAVTALAEDPAVRPMRVRLELEDQGHVDAAGSALEASGGQAGPAIGWADNYELDGNTLYADVHTPAIVAESMEWAFPGRSIEGVFDWTTATGHHHDFVATGLLLLGTSWPGVTTLPDFAEVQAEFAAEVAAGTIAAGTFVAPESAVVPMLEAAAVAARVEPAGRPPRPSREQLAAASLNVADLRLRWYAAESAGELEGLPDSYDYWSWYVTEVRADDDGTLFDLVLDEASGRLWRFDVAAIDGPNVTFAEPIEVVLEVVPVAARAGAADAHNRPRPALARWGSRAESRPAGAAGADRRSNQPTEDDRPMTDAERRALALSLGMTEDTSEADLHAEAARRAAAAPPPGEGSDDPPETPEAGGEGDTDLGDEGAPEGEPVGAAARTATISRERLAELERQAADGAAARAAQIDAERTAAVTAAVEDGRITPAEAGLERNADGSWPDGWRRDLDSAPEVVGAQLERLERGKYPGATARVGGTPASRGGSLERALAASGIRRPNTNGGERQ